MMFNDYFLMPGAALSRATLVGLYLEDFDLSEANLSGSDLSGACLINCNLSHVDLQEARLTNARFSSCNFTNASLDGADLIGTKLTDSNLTNASLRLSTISADTDFSNSNLTDAQRNSCRFIEPNPPQNPPDHPEGGYVVRHAEANNLDSALGEGHLNGWSLVGIYPDISSYEFDVSTSFVVVWRR